MKPIFTTLTRRLRSILPMLIWAPSLFFLVSISYATDTENGQQLSGDDEVFIFHIDPDRRGGKAYKLVYIVKAPIDSFWKFKTDFDNDFLVENKYIQEHNFIVRNGNIVITQDKYTNTPGVWFKWRTTIFADAHRLEFVLINPEQCRQRFHYGQIQLTPVAEGTRVTQMTYFDFWGASLWANYPWGGGMRDFLLYTAHWEQNMFLRLKSRYHNEKPK